ncbi:MAG: tubulin-like doman-containing protein [Turicibacter sp.]|nr:tubulin-like doman-containing protein [Turicibacter sp.]
MFDSATLEKLGTTVADASGNLLFRQEDLASIAGDRYSIIIGVGGSGCATVEDIKRMLKTKVRDIGQRVAFLAIDTDKGSLDRLTQLSAREKLSLAPSVSGADARWQNETTRIAEVKEWVRGDFRQTLEKDGAGRYRQVARAMLFDFGNRANPTNKRTETAIRESFDSLAMVSATKVQVYITLGLAGGTGSGLLIDIADLVHRAAPSGISVEVTGFFYLPDATWEYTKEDDTRTEILQANGYAALKELDYYHSIPQRSGYYEESDAQKPLSKAQYSTTKPLYEMVFLVSGVGTQTAQNAREAVKESLVNLITEKKSNHEDANHQFMGSSWLANKNAARDSTINNLDPSVEGTYPEDTYDYCSVGVGLATIPEDVIKSYAIGYLANTFYSKDGDNTWKENPINAHRAKELIDGLILSKDSLLSKNGGKIRNLCVLKWPTNRISPAPADIVNGTKDSEQARFLKIDEQKTAAVASMREYLDAKYLEFQARAKDILLEYGPKCLLHMWTGFQPSKIYDKSAGISNKLSRLTSGYEDGFDTTKTGNDLANARDRCRGTTATIDSSRIPIFGKIFRGQIPISIKDKMHGWDEAFRRHKVEELISDVAAEIFDNAGGTLVECYINRIKKFMEQVECFDKVLDKMKIAYEGMGADFKKHSDTTKGTPLRYNILGDDEAFEWASDIVHRAVKQEYYQVELRNELVESFVANPSLWAAAEIEDTGYLPARRLYDEAVKKVLDSGTHPINEFSIEAYMQYLKEKNNDDDLGRVAERIVNRVVGQAKSLFPKAQNALQEGTEHIYILIPDNFNTQDGGVEFYNALQTAAQNLEGSVRVFPSPIRGRIVCYRLICALPLNILADIEIWERAYDKSSRREMHSNESDKGRFNPVEGLRWEDYPALAYRRHKMEAEKDCRENRFMREKFNVIFNQAVENGLLCPSKKEDGMFEYVFYNLTRCVPDDYKLDLIGKYDQKDEYGRYLAGEHLINFLIDDNQSDKDTIKEEVKLAYHEKLTDGKTTPEAAKEAAKRALRRHVPMYTAVKKSLRLVQAIKTDIERANQGVSSRKLHELSAKLLSFNFLRKDAKGDWRLFDTHELNRGKSCEVVRMIRAQFKTEKEKALFSKNLHYLLLTEYLSKSDSLSTDENIDIYWEKAEEIYNGIFLQDSFNAGDYIDSLQEVKKEATEFINLYSETIPSYRSYRDNLISELGIKRDEDKQKFWEDSLDKYRAVHELYNELIEKLEVS